MKDFCGWMPIRAFWTEAGFRVDWAFLGELRFTDPFFEQTIGRCLRNPANVLFRHETPVTALEELGRISPGLPPTGFIFHVSRCGSTLISQMLASHVENVVISEASPLDGVLRAHLRDSRISEAQQVRWLRGMINALGQRRHPAERHLFVKFDCWHALFLPLIQKAFPDVPWIFLYRDPVEVMVSHKHQMGCHMIPGALDASLFGWQPEEVGRMRWLEYGARVLHKIYGAGLAQCREGKGAPVNYRELPQAVWAALLPHWKVDCPPEAVKCMAEVAGFQAKNPSLPFEDDTARKEQGATEEIREAARQWLGEVYQQLESRRLAQSAAPARAND